MGMAKFEEEIDSPLQRAGELWQKASGILKEHQLDKLAVSADGESRFVTTQEFVPIKELTRLDVYDLSNEQKRIFNKGYAIAARTNHKKMQAGDSIYLIGNGNYSTPILKFEPHLDNLLELNGTISEVENSFDYVPTILEAIEAGIARVAADQESVARAHRKRLIKTVIGVFAVPMAVAGLAVAIKDGADWKSTHDKEQAAKDAANLANKRREIQEFDIDFPDLQSPLNGVDTAVLASPTERWANIKVPKFNEGGDDLKDLTHSLTSPRYFDVPDKDECDSYDYAINSSDHIRAEDDGDPLDVITIYADSKEDELKICNKGTFKSDKDDVQAKHVFIQITDRA